jgi:hypothetical protein
MPSSQDNVIITAEWRSNRSSHLSAFGPFKTFLLHGPYFTGFDFDSGQVVARSCAAFLHSALKSQDTSFAQSGQWPLVRQ